MNAEERRKAILKRLNENTGPLSATALAKELGVSRQIVVGDIALMRAANHKITATPRGYVIEGRVSGQKQRTIACKHANDKLADELYTVVDNGGGVIDVTVEHPIYGEISGELMIFSRYDVDSFVQKLKSVNAPPLSVLTEGVHLHTVVYPDDETIERILKALKQKNILFE